MRARTDLALLLVSGLSGCAALGYELAWTRLLGIIMGHEAIAMVSVLAGFFLGLALGARLIHARAATMPRPMQAFAVLEVIAAGFALVSPWWLAWLARTLPERLGPWLADTTPIAGFTLVTVCALALLPATVCMGASFPLLVEAHRRRHGSGRAVGRLHGANTLGAMLGVLLTVHVVLAAWGIPGTLLACASLGAVAAALARRIAPASQAAAGEGIEVSGDPDRDVVREPWALWLVLAATGAVGLALEVLIVQILAVRLENTLYTFAHLLAVYLGGVALGAALHQRLASRALAPRPAKVGASLLVVLAITISLSGLTLALVPRLLEGFGSATLGELLVALLAFGPACLVMGATFAHFGSLAAPTGLGRAQAANALGAAAGPALASLWLVPHVGFRDGYYALVYGLIAVIAVFTWARRFSRRWQLVALVLIIASTLIAPPSLALVELEPGWSLVEQRTTNLGVVTVSERGHLRRLQVGQHFRMGGARSFGERRMGHLPLLMHPAPARVMVLGVGTGATLSAVRHHPVTHTDAVEINPAILAMLPHFEAINRRVFADPRVTMHNADARRFVAASSTRYDVIIADLFHPARDGAAALYSREHFAAVASHLHDRGLFAQWLPLHQLDRDSLAAIARSFCDVFENVEVVLGLYNVETPAIVLVGSTQPVVPQLAALEARAHGDVFGELGLDEPREWLGAHLLDRDGLRRWAGEGPRNTDLHPIVTTSAPAAAYADDPGLGFRNLASLLEAREPWTVNDGLLQADLERFGDALQLYLYGEQARVEAWRAGERRLPKAAIDRFRAAAELEPRFAPAWTMLRALAR